MSKIKRGDKVLIISGKNRNQTGVVERVLAKQGKAVVTGMNMVKKHLKRSAQNPQGGIIDKPMPLQLANLMLLDSNKDKPTRVGFKVSGKNKVRIGRLSGQEMVTKK